MIKFVMCMAGVQSYLAPWLQAVPGYLAPNPGYLHPWGASCPDLFTLPPSPPNTN